MAPVTTVTRAGQGRWRCRPHDPVVLAGRRVPGQVVDVVIPFGRPKGGRSHWLLPPFPSSMESLVDLPAGRSVPGGVRDEPRSPTRPTLRPPRSGVVWFHHARRDRVQPLRGAPSSCPLCGEDPAGTPLPVRPHIAESTSTSPYVPLGVGLALSGLGLALVTTRHGWALIPAPVCVAVWAVVALRSKKPRRFGPVAIILIVDPFIFVTGAQGRPTCAYGSTSGYWFFIMSEFLIAVGAVMLDASLPRQDDEMSTGVPM